MIDVLILLVLAGILGGAGYYVYRARKRGQKCIGCPASGSCSGACSSCSARCPHQDK